jgi:D-alanyl-D-alanine carboxypeptidase/D-alanyl-D-alanine-endopeptidase (penicillin-binding protein 4)
MKKKIYLFLIMFTCATGIAFPQGKRLTLNEEINLWKNNSFFEHAGIGICVLDPVSGEVLAETSPQLSLVPGSTLKLLTTATALEMLGPDFRFETVLAYSGEIRNDTLTGNLHIVGGGDPALGSNYFKEHYLHRHFLDEWVKKVAQLHIKYIRGNIITDATIFEEQTVPDTWIWEDIGNYYGAGACGISVYDNLYRIHFSSPEQAGKQTEIRRIEPFIPELIIDNQVKSSNENRDLAYVYGAPMENKRTIRGTVPKGRKDFVIKASIPNPPLLLGRELLDRLKEANIPLEGAIVNHQKNMEIPTLNTVAKTISPKLADIVRVTNHESVNLFAEHLLKYLAYLMYGEGTTKKGIEIVADYWEKKGIDMDGFFMDDGGGLSHFNAMTARQMVEVLHYMKTKSPEGKAFFNSIPYVPNGTLYFFNPMSFPGESLRAKSGSMKRVRCYAGELKTRSNQTVLFAVLMNNFSCSQRTAIELTENLLVRLSRH